MQSSRSMANGRLGLIEKELRKQEQFENHQNTAFIGGIPEGVTDGTVRQLLDACGLVKEWRRVQDALNAFKNFGFCTFESADSLLRCKRVLDDVALLGSRKRLMVRIDAKIQRYLDVYNEQVAEMDRLMEISSDVESCKACIEICSRMNLTMGVEEFEKRLQTLSYDRELGEVCSDDDDDDDDDDDGNSAADGSIAVDRERMLNEKRRMLAERLRNELESEQRRCKAAIDRWEERELRMSLTYQRHLEQKKEVELAHRNWIVDVESFRDQFLMDSLLRRLLSGDDGDVVVGRPGAPLFYVNRDRWLQSVSSSSGSLQGIGPSQMVSSIDDSKPEHERLIQSIPVDFALLNQWIFPIHYKFDFEKLRSVMTRYVQSSELIDKSMLMIEQRSTARDVQVFLSKNGVDHDDVVCIVSLLWRHMIYMTTQ